MLRLLAFVSGLLGLGVVIPTWLLAAVALGSPAVAPASAPEPDAPPPPCQQPATTEPGAAPRVIKRTPLPYPDNAASLGFGSHQCTADIRLSTRGVPTEVKISGCPLVFHSSATRSIRQWRWDVAPSKASGPPTRAQLSVTYQRSRP